MYSIWIPAQMILQLWQIARADCRLPSRKLSLRSALPHPVRSGHSGRFAALIRRYSISRAATAMHLLAMPSTSLLSCAGADIKAGRHDFVVKWLGGRLRPPSHFTTNKVTYGEGPMSQKLTGSNPVTCLAQLARNLSEVDAIDDDPHTRDGDQLPLQPVLHLICRNLAVQVDDIVLDQRVNILRSFELPSSLQALDTRVDSV